MGRTYQHADDGDQEGDLHQAVEDEEDAANHLVGGGVEWSRNQIRSEECAQIRWSAKCPDVFRMTAWGAGLVVD